MTWRDEAACRGESPDVFFPAAVPNRTTVPTPLEEAALAFCRRCSVTADCLAWAVSSGQYLGVAGGMTQHQRFAYRRRLRREGAA